MSKIKVRNIKLVRGEGPIELSGKTEIVSSYEEANETLARWSHTVHGKGSDKCDFTVEFMDGEIYEGTYNLKNASQPQEEAKIPDLKKRIGDYLRHITGELRPDWMTDENWENSLRANAPYMETAKGFLSKYDV